jgi:hypothetical protein
MPEDFVVGALKIGNKVSEMHSRWSQWMIRIYGKNQSTNAVSPEAAVQGG